MSNLLMRFAYCFRKSAYYYFDCNKMSKNIENVPQNTDTSQTKNGDTNAPKNMSKRGNMGNTLSAQTRAVVFNVLQFALREKKAKTPIMDINKAMDRVAAMTGLCRDTLSKIKKEGSSNGGIWENKVKKKRPKVITNPNDVDKIHIINKIEEFEKRNEAITLRKLHSELKQENNFSGGRTSLLIVLRSMGYKWEKNESNKKVLQKVPIAIANSSSKIEKKESSNINKDLLQDRNSSSSVSPICSIKEQQNIGKQNTQEQKFIQYQESIPIQGPSHMQGPSHLQGPTHQQGPSHSQGLLHSQGPHQPQGLVGPYNIQRPLLLHASHYIFNHNIM